MQLTNTRGSFLTQWWLYLFQAPTVIVLILVSPASHAEYTLGVVPQFDARRIQQIWQPIIDEVERHVGTEIELVGTPSIPDFERDLVAGRFDLAYMNPYHFVLANDAAGYVPLVRDVGRQLRGILVVDRLSGIRSVDEIDGQVIAFPAPNALGASLLMQHELAEKYNVRIIPRYVKTHDSVYLNVLLGQTVAGGGVQKTLNRQQARVRERLVIIHETQAVSPHPIAAHPRVPVAERQRLIEIFLQIDDSPNGRQLLGEIPIKRIGAANVDDYTNLRAMHLERYYNSQ